MTKPFFVIKIWLKAFYLLSGILDCVIQALLPLLLTYPKLIRHTRHHQPQTHTCHTQAYTLQAHLTSGTPQEQDEEQATKKPTNLMLKSQSTSPTTTTAESHAPQEMRLSHIQKIPSKSNPISMTFSNSLLIHTTSNNIHLIWREGVRQ